MGFFSRKLNALQWHYTTFAARMALATAHRGRRRFAPRFWCAMAGLRADTTFVLASVTPISALSVPGDTILPPTDGVSVGIERARESETLMPSPRTVRFPAINRHRIEGVWIDGRSGSMLIGEQHFVSDWTWAHLELSRIKGISVFGHAGDVVLHALPKSPIIIRDGIHLGGYHSQNWYHLLVEILPRVELLDRTMARDERVPLLVPGSLGREGTFREALLAAIGDWEHILLPEDEAVFVENLIRVDDAVLYLPGWGNGATPRQGLEVIQVDAMMRHKQRLQDQLLPASVTRPYRRIFLDRVEDKDRSYNREAVVSIAQRYGFECIVAGNLSLRDQAKIFSEAEFIIGPSGAQWTNLLFASRGARGLAWIVDPWIEFSAFRNLAHLSGAELRYLSIPSRSADFAHSDYQVDAQVFESAVRDLITKD